MSTRLRLINVLSEVTHMTKTVSISKKLKQYSLGFRSEVLKLAERISIAAIPCTLTVLQQPQLTVKSSNAF